MKTQTLLKQTQKCVLGALLLLLFAQVNAMKPFNFNALKADSLVVEPDRAFGVSPAGAFLGIYSFHFEYLLDEQNGIAFQSDYRVVPTDHDNYGIEATGRSFTINYRFHIMEGLDAPYVGVFAKYRTYFGKGSKETNSFDFSRSDYTMGINAGKRWIWENGFMVNISLGYGYVREGVFATESNQTPYNSVRYYMHDNHLLNGFLGELSIGYAFRGKKNRK